MGYRQAPSPRKIPGKMCDFLKIGGGKIFQAGIFQACFISNNPVSSICNYFSVFTLTTTLLHVGPVYSLT